MLNDNLSSDLSKKIFIKLSCQALGLSRMLTCNNYTRCLPHELIVLRVIVTNIKNANCAKSNQGKVKGVLRELVSS